MAALLELRIRLSLMMNPDKIATYRRLLEAKRSELLARKLDRAGIMIERAPDSLEELALKNERDLAVDNLNRTAELFSQVSAALERIAQGTYGQCLRCDGPIGERRLHALPWAAFCLECQEGMDRAGIASPDPRLSDAA